MQMINSAENSKAARGAALRFSPSRNMGVSHSLSLSLSISLSLYLSLSLYIYIYIERERERGGGADPADSLAACTWSLAPVTPAHGAKEKGKRWNRCQ